MVKLTVDNMEIQAEEGTNLLEVCLENNIYIPNLCHLSEMKEPPASCRLCFVEMEGKKKPVPSCTLKVKAGMIIKTGTPAVRRLQRTALKLLLSAHHVNCRPCPANKKCALQDMAKFLKVGLKPRRLENIREVSEPVGDHSCLLFYPDRCVLCGKCVYVCRTRQEKPHLSFAKRGLDTTISFYGEKNLDETPCESCLDCVAICPVSAITKRYKV